MYVLAHLGSYGTGGQLSDPGDKNIGNWDNTVRPNI